MTTLAELKALLDAATPGPHEPISRRNQQRCPICSGDYSIDDKTHWRQREQDASLIVALRNAAPALIAVVEAASVVMAGDITTLGGILDPSKPDTTVNKLSVRNCDYQALAEALEQLEAVKP